MGLDKAMSRLATELLSQYKVVYSRPQSLIAPEKVSVSSARPEVVVHGTPARGENGDVREVQACVRAGGGCHSGPDAPSNAQRRNRPRPTRPRPRTDAAFRAGVDVVSLNVTVTDATNRYITDLDQRGLFRVRGRRQAGA